MCKYPLQGTCEYPLQGTSYPHGKFFQNLLLGSCLFGSSSSSDLVTLSLASLVGALLVFMVAPVSGCFRFFIKACWIYSTSILGSTRTVFPASPPGKVLLGRGQLLVVDIVLVVQQHTDLVLAECHLKVRFMNRIVPTPYSV